MEQLLCEPEDRLGSQSTASVSRPNSMIINARRSGFMPVAGKSGSVDGADLIKVINCHLHQAEICMLISKDLRLTLGLEELTG